MVSKHNRKSQLIIERLKQEQQKAKFEFEQYSNYFIGLLVMIATIGITVSITLPDIQAKIIIGIIFTIFLIFVYFVFRSKLKISADIFYKKSDKIISIYDNLIKDKNIKQTKNLITRNKSNHNRNIILLIIFLIISTITLFNSINNIYGKDVKWQTYTTYTYSENECFRFSPSFYSIDTQENLVYIESHFLKTCDNFNAYFYAAFDQSRHIIDYDIVADTTSIKYLSNLVNNTISIKLDNKTFNLSNAWQHSSSKRFYIKLNDTKSTYYQVNFEQNSLPYRIHFIYNTLEYSCDEDCFIVLNGQTSNEIPIFHRYNKAVKEISVENPSTLFRFNPQNTPYVYLVPFLMSIISGILVGLIIEIFNPKNQN